MAITVNASPKAVSLSKHPIEYELQTDNHVIVAGTKTLFVIKITANPTVDDVFTIAWGTDPVGSPDEAVQFTCKAAPDDSGTQFIDNAGAIPLTDWVDLLRDDLEKNFALSRDFVITKTSADAMPAIQLKARTKGVKYSINFTETLVWLIQFLNTAGTNRTFQSNMKMLLQVHVEDVYKSGNFELKHEEQRDPDINSKSLFDVHSVLEAFLENNLPSFNQATISRCNKLVKQYFVRYYERYGNTVTEQEVLTGTTKSVMMGGTEFEFFNQNKDFFVDHLTPTKSFLTWQPDNKEVSTSQQEFLYFPITGGATSIKSKADIFYTDGTSDQDKLIELKAGTLQYEIYLVPVGYTQVINAVADASRTVDSYVIKVTDQDNVVISQLRTYFLHRKVHQETEYLLYRNSLGAYETLRITGEIIKGLKITKQVFQTILPSNYSLTDAEFTEINTSGRDSQKVSTGYITKAELQHLKEFLLSGSRFQISDGEYLPLTLKTDKIEFYQTSEDLFAMTFEIMSAYMTNSYTDA